MTKSAEQIIADANRITAFLKDPVIAEAMSRFERRTYEELIGADSSEKRVVAHVKANVLRDFETELRSILDAGESEVLKAAKTSAKS
jgi:hypothetical protein